MHLINPIKKVKGGDLDLDKRINAFTEADKKTL
jgi:hypothetical protein